MDDFLTILPKITTIGCLICLIAALIMIMVQAPWAEILADDDDDEEPEETEPDDCYSEVAR